MEILVWLFVVFIVVPFVWGMVREALKGDKDYTPPKKRRRGATVARRDVLWAIRQGGANGIGRGAIIDKLGVKGDKTAENSVTYQLSELRKRRSVRHEGRKYYAR